MKVDSDCNADLEASKDGRPQKLADADPLPSSTDERKQTVLEMHGYKIMHVLGQGSYATVKSAYSQRHKTLVAVKIISKRKAPGDYLEKFLPREIDVVKLLKHPSLVVFLQSIETNNRVYLIMENASGGDLLETIRLSKYIKENQAGLWFNQLVDGIQYCHDKGVVHRDLKCENLLLDDSNNLKITDFGFARADMSPDSSGRIQLSETYCGSYAYAAPEILTGTPYVPQMADIWSIGVILFVMVVGRLPFDDSNHKKLLKQVHKGPVFSERREVSNDCKNLMTAILVKVEQRLSLAAIRRHRWTKAMLSANTEPGADPNSSKIKDSFSDKCKKAILNFGRSSANS